MLHTVRGWLLDMYEDAQEGICLWLITDADERVCLRQSFPVAFYASGEPPRLRELYKECKREPGVLGLHRREKRDVFLPEPITLLEITTDTPRRQLRLFERICQHYTDLTFYDADIPVNIRHAARYGTFPMAFCECECVPAGRVQALHPLNSRWDVNVDLPPYRILEISPDRDPNRDTPQTLSLKYNLQEETLPLSDPAGAIRRILEVLERQDPDFLITDWGDLWLLPTLQRLAEETQQRLPLNRDPQKEIHWQKELSYFSYGQIIFRAQEAHLYGRCHVDRKSAMMWKDYGLPGALESARVTTLSIEKAARVSPGQGISAMQMITALENDILVPWHKQQTEAFKTGLDLIHSDRGGLIYQPLIGLHTDVAQVDFVSMYPAVIIFGNISPEVPMPDGIIPAQEELGVVPRTLKPLYEKRVKLKLAQGKYPKSHPRAQEYKARSSALKWLLVVCFGYLGYKNARYGRIEAHEAVTRGGREVLLQAKEVAEMAGFEVLHLFVDALWLKKKGCCQTQHFQSILEDISQRTGLAIALDGIYRWVAFLPSRGDARVPVANRYFGVFQDGEIKVRGLECRRRDTPVWIAEVQMRMIEMLAQARRAQDLPEYIPLAFAVFRNALQDLKEGKIPAEKLVVKSRVSYDLKDYRSPTAAARAAQQLVAAGRSVRPGQKIGFVFTRGEKDVIAWDLEAESGSRRVDVEKYVELLARAASSVLYPFGIDPDELKTWAHEGLVQRSWCIWSGGRFGVAPAGKS